MTKSDFLHLLANAYDFPDYFGHNLDAADEILAEKLEAAGAEQLSLAPFFEALLADAPPEERRSIQALLARYFW